MEDPYFPNYPKDALATVGPRNLLHTWATDTDDPTVHPRWGKVGKQKIVDEGGLAPHPNMGTKYNMETVDDHILDLSIDFMEKSQQDGKPFFVWLNPTRMHVYTHLSPKYEALRNGENGWSIQEAGMVQFDDIIGSVMQKLEDMGVADNTIIVVTTDNGTEGFTWPDGGTTPFAGWKGEVGDGGFRVPMIMRWPGKVKPNQVINGVMSGLDFFPTFVAAAGNPNIKTELLKGKTLGGKTFKNHLDGYDQTALLTGAGKTAREEVWYFTQTTLAAARIGDYKMVLIEQPEGWFGPTQMVNMPRVYNLRLDPFERMGYQPGQSKTAFGYTIQNLWRAVFLQQHVAELAKSAIEYPPLQQSASFNLDAVQEKIKSASQGPSN
jgi:arylsulfatase